VYGFDFLEGIKRILATGRVLTTHLHSNYSANSGTSRARYTDDHESLNVGNVPVREALRLLSGSGANLVIEAKKEALKNGIYLHTLLAEELQQATFAEALALVLMFLEQAMGAATEMTREIIRSLIDRFLRDLSPIYGARWPLA
jgi:hypothetical protein